MNKPRTIKVDMLARVEGEGAVYVRFSGSKVAEVKLKIFEPPRLFEAFLRGRHFREVPDIVARICGICPVAYQMSAVHAIEKILGVNVHPAVRALRRLLYCGEWIESHALHVYLLHAPDFLGYPDALTMARHHAPAVQAGLALKKTGNQVVIALGGREIHPVGARVGGFYRMPPRQELLQLLPSLRAARELAVGMVELVRTFEFPAFEREYEFVALRHPAEYPMNEGRVVSSQGIDLPVEEYNDQFAEKHMGHSNALHSQIRGRGSYFVGPLARFNLNFDRLPLHIQQLARESGVEPPCRNPFKSIIVRGIETLLAVEEAIRIVEQYEPPPEDPMRVGTQEPAPRAGIGHAATEAPRGLLYHRYELDANGLVVAARIVPPTAQNQKGIEEDLWGVADQSADLNEERLRLLCEQSIRNYDPCISCATHFLKLEVRRS